MPVTKQAIKKVRQDKRKTIINTKKKGAYKQAVHKARKGATNESINVAFRALDRAAKVNVIHANKAARLKSRLSKLLKSPKVSIPVTVSKVKKSS